MPQPIKPESFRELVTSGAVKSATILGQKGGYALLASIGMQQRPLGTRTGAVRMFSTADTALKLLRELGVYHVNVDVTHYEAGSLRPPRPDTAQKNRAANAALEHDKWFRAQVREVRDGLKDGTVDLVDSETMWGRLRARARELDAGQARPTSKPRRKA
ncbi:MAG: hypothetical protein KGK06_04960 [Xanthomonadaceae bacterium]|nr:hypothetical protein [Xanthomonadaceae bacterium]MDE2315737.1 hypothetical protein [Xanthomonadaceae bacterium]